MADAAIPLSVRPPRIEDPLDQAGKLMSLSRMKRQGEQQDQMFPEQLRSAQLANQEHETAIKDQEIFAKAYRDSQGDLTKTLQNAAQQGASGKGIMAFNSNLATVRQKLATTDKTTLANDAARHDQLRGRLESFRQQPDDYKTANWTGFMEQAHKDGLLKPEEHKQWLQQYEKWDDDQGEMLSHSLASGHQLTTEAIAEQNAAAHAANVKNSTRRADAAVEAAGLKTEAQRTKDAATLLGTAADADDYTQKLYSLDPKIREKFKGVAGGDEFDQEAVRKAADRIAMSPEERTRADQSAATAERLQDRAASSDAHRKILEAQGWARIAKKSTKEGKKPGGLTDYQQTREAAAIQAEEYGKGNNLGVHTQRRTIGGYLKSGKDKDGKKLTPEQVTAYQSEMKDLDERTQNIQVRKAKLYGIPAPPPAVIASVPEGKTAKSPDGHTWRKQNGILYFVQ